MEMLMRAAGTVGGQAAKRSLMRPRTGCLSLGRAQAQQFTLPLERRGHVEGMQTDVGDLVVPRHGRPRGLHQCHPPRGRFHSSP